MRNSFVISDKNGPIANDALFGPIVRNNGDEFWMDCVDYVCIETREKMDESGTYDKEKTAGFESHYRFIHTSKIKSLETLQKMVPYGETIDNFEERKYEDSYEDRERKKKRKVVEESKTED